MLKLDHISKTYPQRGLVLNALNLEMKPGETLAIKGPSGSGKTTLLNIIGLLDKADKGSIFFSDKEIKDYSTEASARYRRESIGFVFQDHLLMPHLKIIENIYLPLFAEKRSLSELQELKEHANMLIRKMGISDIENSYPHEVSGGEAQRATLVRALVNKPSLLLADEPTGSLDSDNSETLAKLLLDVNSELGTSIIAVTHSDKFASSFSRIMSLKNGILS